MANCQLPDVMIMREAERLRWEACGRVGVLDENRFACGCDSIAEEVLVRAIRDGVVLKLPAAVLRLSLDDLSGRYLEPWIRDLPSVKASEHARAEARRAAGNAEYDSWGRT